MMSLKVSKVATASMVLPEGPSFDFMSNLTPTQSQNNVSLNGDGDYPGRIGLDDVFPLKKKRKGHGISRNIALQKKKESGEPFEIQFPAPFYKV